MEVAKRFYYGSLVPTWFAFANAVGGFLEVMCFRLVLAFKVIIGRTPIETEKRPWVRSRETPVVIDVYDWTTERLVFSILVWPSLESPPEEAEQVFYERVQQVKEIVAAGAGSELAFSTHFVTDYELGWDARRECWVGTDGYRYDGNMANMARQRVKVIGPKGGRGG